MTVKELLARLNSGRICMDERDAIVDDILQSPELLRPLIQLVFKEDNTENWHCSWVFDNVMRRNLSLLIPHLDVFCEGLNTLKSESVIRPMAHTCELLAIAYYVKMNKSFREGLNNRHLELITESCFDWLIGKHKVASKVFAMASLFYLGSTFDWVRPELKSVLEQQITEGSAGFKSRGSKTLEKLKKLGY